MQIIFGAMALSISAAFADLEPPVQIRPPIPTRVIGGKFESALERTISATWSSVPLRMILNDVAREQKTAILLDRRIDSGREMPWEFKGRPLRAELADLAKGHGAAMSIAGNAVYIGPASSARKLRTLIHLRRSEVIEKSASLSKGRDRELMRVATAHWGDLARPADLIRQLSELYKLEVRGGEQISHDLWAGCTLPAASAVEALSLILIQFDFTFEWTGDASGIRIVPIPDKVTFARVYKPGNGSAKTTAEKWRAEFPDAEFELKGREINVVGTVEEHEAIAALLQPNRANGKKNGSTKPVPLSQKTFTLKVQGAPVRSILQELEKQGVEIILDEQKLKDAGIDIDKRIDLEVDQADADKFFRAICEPLKIQFKIDGQTVTLSPK